MEIKIKIDKWLMLPIILLLLNSFLAGYYINKNFNNSIYRKNILLNNEIGENPFKNMVLFKNTTTGSMRPFIKENTTVHLELVNNNTELKIGDVAIYKLPEKNVSVMHRILFINDNKYIFKGDNNSCPDNKVIERKYIKYKIIGVDYD